MQDKNLPAKAAEAKKMKALLESEGWEPYGSFNWIDPTCGAYAKADEAYRLAMKRKAARERAILLKAGFWYRSSAQMWFRHDFTFEMLNQDFLEGFTRSEALQKLATARRSRKNPIIPNPQSQSRKP